MSNTSHFPYIFNLYQNQYHIVVACLPEPSITIAHCKYAGLLMVDSDRGILTLSPDLTVYYSYIYGYDGPNPNMAPYIGLLVLYIGS